MLNMTDIWVLVSLGVSLIAQVLLIAITWGKGEL